MADGNVSNRTALRTGLMQALAATRSNGPRRNRNTRAGDGAESDDSLPSLQTVSDSSEEEYSDYDGATEDDDLEDDLPALARESDAQPRRTIHPNIEDEGSESEEEVDENDGPGASQSRSAFDFRESVLRALNMQSGDVTPDSNFALRNMLGALRPPRFALDEIFRPPHTHSEADPLRAEIIMASLEVIPDTLIQRYEKLRGGHADEFDGCAICRDNFLSVDELEAKQQAANAAIFSELPLDRFRMPSIVAFPCPGMHLFHDHCISPWLSRKTTCPSCRFDLDPDSLTLSCIQSKYPNKKWEPPKSKTFLTWLRNEENKQNGIQSEGPALELPALPRYVSEDGLDATLDSALEEQGDDDDNAWETENEDDEDEGLMDAATHLLFPHLAQGTLRKEVADRTRLTYFIHYSGFTPIRKKKRNQRMTMNLRHHSYLQHLPPNPVSLPICRISRLAHHMRLLHLMMRKNRPCPSVILLLRLP
ncbi:unnamed protein product [Somion occarium]|uniref:RING-type domain-containing protein n=1 Tax=Somion occarium TaxID=3059160 RepID=A0ABP1DZ57_9APHY